MHSSAQCTTLKYALVTSAEKCERLSLGKRPLSRFVAVSRAAASRKSNHLNSNIRVHFSIESLTERRGRR